MCFLAISVFCKLEADILYDQIEQNDHLEQNDQVELNPFGNDTVVGGDMVLTKSQDKILKARNFGNWVRKWKNGVIPYQMSGDVRNNFGKWVDQAAGLVRQATGGCIKFQRRTNERDYVNMVNGQGCQSRIGYEGGAQYLSLQVGGICNCLGVVIHEMMHAAGMSHEHQRNDRDSYINVNWNNVAGNQRGNFDKMQGQTFGLPFDYNSIMLYGSYLFGINNRQPTTTKKGGGELADLCRKNNLSSVDVQKIKKFYGC